MSNKIDHIFYINLERRPDRREQIEEELNNMQLSYERFNAVDRVPGCVGCCYSHLSVLKLAKERGYKNVLIFEDDFTFRVSKEEFERRLNAFFELYGDNYDVFMLSYNMRESSDVVMQDGSYDFKMKQVLYAQTASGYIVNSKYYDKLINLYEWAFPMLERTGEHWIYMNDVVWKCLQRSDRWYCMEPRYGVQRESFSDLAGGVCNYGV